MILLITSKGPEMNSRLGCPMWGQPPSAVHRAKLESFFLGPTLLPSRDGLL